MRIDRLRNIEMAKRNQERLRQPSLFPSVPSGNPQTSLRSYSLGVNKRVRDKNAILARLLPSPDLAGTLKPWARRTCCKTGEAFQTTDLRRFARHVQCYHQSLIINPYILLSVLTGVTENDGRDHADILSHTSLVSSHLYIFISQRTFRAIIESYNRQKKVQASDVVLAPGTGRSCSGTFSHRTHMYNSSPFISR